MKSPPAYALGIDGCRAGWIWVRVEAGGGFLSGVSPTIESLVAQHPDASDYFIDMPIGISDEIATRACDVTARSLLQQRRSSVFVPPCRSALAAADHATANALNRQHHGKGLSRQAYNIGPKILEVDAFLHAHPDYPSRFHEVHPEVCFLGLAGRPMVHGKKTEAGREERLSTLGLACPPALTFAREELDRWRYRQAEALKDDFVDALVAAVMSQAPSRERRDLGDPTQRAGALPMRIRYWDRLNVTKPATDAAAD